MENWSKAIIYDRKRTETAHDDTRTYGLIIIIHGFLFLSYWLTLGIASTSSTTSKLGASSVSCLRGRVLANNDSENCYDDSQNTLMCELFMKNVIHIPVDKNVQRNVTLPVPSCSGIFENVRRVKWKDAFDAVHVRIMSLRIIHTCTQYIYFSPWSRDTRVQESKRQCFEPFRENGISSWRWISSSC